MAGELDAFCEEQTMTENRYALTGDVQSVVDYFEANPLDLPDPVDLITPLYQALMHIHDFAQYEVDVTGLANAADEGLLLNEVAALRTFVLEVVELARVSARVMVGGPGAERIGAAMGDVVRTILDMDEDVMPAAESAVVGRMYDRLEEFRSYRSDKAKYIKPDSVAGRGGGMVVE